jgi:hypothetical protein
MGRTRYDRGGMLVVPLFVLSGVAVLSALSVGSRAAELSSTRIDPPSPVTSLRVTAVTTTSVTLQWVDPTSANYAGAMIRRALGSMPPDSPTSGTLVAKVSKPGEEYTNSGLFHQGNSGSMGSFATHFARTSTMRASTNVPRAEASKMSAAAT